MMDMEQEETKEKEREVERRKENRKLRLYKRNIKDLLFGKEGVLEIFDHIRV
jgi:hypothetical protein